MELFKRFIGNIERFETKREISKLVNKDLFDLTGQVPMTVELLEK